MGSGYEQRAPRARGQDPRRTQRAGAPVELGPGERSRSTGTPWGRRAPPAPRPPALLEVCGGLAVEGHVGTQPLEARVADPLHVAQLVQRLEAAALLAQVDD